jgi:hypothetical protein
MIHYSEGYGFTTEDTESTENEGEKIINQSFLSFSRSSLCSLCPLW